MKNEDIHKGLFQTDIRDFLAREYERSWTIGGGDIAFLEKEIAELQDMLTKAKKRQAIRLLIESQGWEDWDVSDEVPYNSSTYFPFVGTEEEYDVLIKELKGND